MVATRSVEENIRIQFDRFYDECEFKNQELSDLMKQYLKALEENIVIEATSEYTSEYQEIYDEGYENGRETGYDEGFEVGYEEGYSQGFYLSHEGQK